MSSDEAVRKRLIYRSKQRGLLEVDLVLGSWATKHVMTLTKRELKQYESLLNEETIDLYNYLSGQTAVPQRLNTPLLQRIQAYCFESPKTRSALQC